MIELLPWQVPSWQRFEQGLRQDRLAHALLLTGATGLGKRQLARRMAASLLCVARREDASPCGGCRGCQLFAADSHPDQQRVEREEGKRQIRVDQLRELIDFLHLKSQYAGFRVGLVLEADAMNTSAANSLLKTLEEPPAGVVLILTAERAGAVPATVRSRCQQLPVPLPTAAEASAWLSGREPAGAASLLGLAGGAPLRALELAASDWSEHAGTLQRQLGELRTGRLDAVAAAGHWKGGLHVLVPLLSALLHDLLRLAGAGAPPRTFGDARPLQGLMEGIDLLELHGYLDRVLEARRRLDHPLNEQLVAEELLLGWQRLARRQAH